MTFEDHTNGRRRIKLLRFNFAEEGHMLRLRRRLVEAKIHESVSLPTHNCLIDARTSAGGLCFLACGRRGTEAKSRTRLSARNRRARFYPPHLSEEEGARNIVVRHVCCHLGIDTVDTILVLGRLRQYCSRHRQPGEVLSESFVIPALVSRGCHPFAIDRMSIEMGEF